MPSWLKDFLGGLSASGSAALRWLEHQNNAWFNWADSMIHQLWRMILQAYIVLTWDLANFSYFVGSFSATARQWVQWLAYERIPKALYLARTYAYYQARSVRLDARAARRRLEVRVDARITIVALNLAAAIRQEIINRRNAITRLNHNLTVYINGVAFTLATDIAAEIRNRKAAIAALSQRVFQAIASLTKIVNAIIPSVNKMAAAGYNSVRPQQASIVQKIVDDLATDNPVVKDLVGKLASLVLDLAAVDDPIARLAAQLLITQVIDRLGVDKLAGQLLGQLGGAFLGMGQPAGLQDVTRQIAQRLNAGEAQWQQFYANGGDDIEQLGSEMRESANPLFTAGMVAYFAGAVADPAGTAAVTADVVVPAARAILTPVLAALEAL